ncbi:hypothetical protein FRB98_005129, partial [Tulasnella sp. 332]
MLRRAIRFAVAPPRKVGLILHLTRDVPKVRNPSEMDRRGGYRVGMRDEGGSDEPRGVWVLADASFRVMEESRDGLHVVAKELCPLSGGLPETPVTRLAGT